MPTSMPQTKPPPPAKDPFLTDNAALIMKLSHYRQNTAMPSAVWCMNMLTRNRILQLTERHALLRAAGYPESDIPSLGRL